VCENKGLASRDGCSDGHACYDSIGFSRGNVPDLARCAHKRTQLIARDDDAEYVECLDCGAILETRELSASPPAPAPDTRVSGADPAQGASDKPDTIDESLSDA
jgi:hypothetical protein